MSVAEVDRPLTKMEVHLERKPHPGYYVEKKGVDIMKAKREFDGAAATKTASGEVSAQ